MEKDAAADDDRAGEARAEPPDGRAARWRRRLLQSRWPLVALFWSSFAETVIVPIPIEVVLIPLMLARRRQIWTIATVTMAGCLLGAIVGYGVGYFIFETLGRWALEAMGYGEEFNQFQRLFRDHAFFAIIAIGVIPIPFQVAMLAAGLAKYPFFMFLLATVIARGIRYYGLALFVLWFGERAVWLWRCHSKTFALVAIGLIAIVAYGSSQLTKLAG